MSVVTDAHPPAAYSGLKSGCCSGGTGLPLRRRCLVGQRSGVSSEASLVKGCSVPAGEGSDGVGNNLSGSCVGVMVTAGGHGQVWVSTNDCGWDEYRDKFRFLADS